MNYAEINMNQSINRPLLALIEIYFRFCQTSVKLICSLFTFGPSLKFLIFSCFWICICTLKLHTNMWGFRALPLSFYPCAKKRIKKCKVCDIVSSNVRGFMLIYIVIRQCRSNFPGMFFFLSDLIKSGSLLKLVTSKETNSLSFVSLSFVSL